MKFSGYQTAHRIDKYINNQLENNPISTKTIREWLKLTRQIKTSLAIIEDECLFHARLIKLTRHPTWLTHKEKEEDQE